MIYLLFIPALYVFLMTCWLFYIGIMNLVRVRHELNTAAKIFAYPIVVLGFIFNYLLTTIVGSVLFLDFNFTDAGLTKRLHRTQEEWPADHWRHRLAEWICHELLDALDPTGDHC